VGVARRAAHDPAAVTDQDWQEAISAHEIARALRRNDQTALAGRNEDTVGAGEDRAHHLDAAIHSRSQRPKTITIADSRSGDLPNQARASPARNTTDATGEAFSTPNGRSASLHNTPATAPMGRQEGIARFRSDSHTPPYQCQISFWRGAFSEPVDRQASLDRMRLTGRAAERQRGVPPGRSVMLTR
jgi:hypothetical protein